MPSHSFDSAARLYDNFRPQERLVLVLEAMARGDETEADRLRHACPRKTYTGPDAAFEDRFHLALDIVAIVSIDLRSLVSQLRILHWAINTVQYFSAMHHINTSMALMEGIRCDQGLSQSPYFARMMKHMSRHGATEEPAEDENSKGEELAADLSGMGDDFCDRMEAVEAQSERTTELIVNVLHRTGFEVAQELMSIWQAFGDFTRSRLSLEPMQLITAGAHPSRQDLEDALKIYASLKADEESVQKYRQAICEVWDKRFSAEQR